MPLDAAHCIITQLCCQRLRRDTQLRICSTIHSTKPFFIWCETVFHLVRINNLSSRGSFVRGRFFPVGRVPSAFRGFSPNMGEPLKNNGSPGKRKNRFLNSWPLISGKAYSIFSAQHILCIFFWVLNGSPTPIYIYLISRAFCVKLAPSVYLRRTQNGCFY